MCSAFSGCVRSGLSGRRLLKKVCTFVLIAGLLATGSQAAEKTATQTIPKSPLSARESFEHFRLHPDLKIELVAAEPDVVDPVAIAFDEDGRLWVAEMIDYPNGPQPGKPPMSRIRLLEDRDGDGRYEISRVFADRILFVTGMQPWRGGVIVTLSGEVAHFRDSNADGKFDVRQTWFTGFKQENSQLRANHPTFGLDNHIYIANGLRGGVVVAKKQQWSKDAKPVSISGMDFRFDPLSGEYEAISGNGQFGVTFDDFGNRFVCSNRNPCKHLVLEDRYIKRNPYLAVGAVFHDVSPAGANSRVYAISRPWTTSTLHAGQFTAACGVSIYRGDALPAEFLGNSFTCEPTGNLVHRDVLHSSGATFDSRPGRQKVAFLASRDEWFRPVNTTTGPDGALYIVDMYRAVIEHPQFVPDELKNRPDERYGDTRGRIYRIVPKHRSSIRKTPHLSTASTTELVKLLEHPNSWQRETAARLIYERQDKTVCDQLEKLVRQGKTPQARVHALWALDGLGKLTQPMVLAAMDDPDQRVREQTVLLAERWLREKKGSTLVDKLFSLAETGDARLRFQVALSLGEAADRATAEKILASLALSSAADPWTRKAIISSLPNGAGGLFEAVLHKLAESGRWSEPGMPEFIGKLAETIGSQQIAAQIQIALASLGKIDRLHKNNDDATIFRVQLAGLNGLGLGVNRRGRSLSSFLAGFSKEQRKAVEAIFQRAVRIAQTQNSGLGLRQASVRVLRHGVYGVAGAVLKELARSEPNQSLRLTAIATLARYAHPEIGKVLLADLKSQTPTLRRALIDAMLSNTGRTRMLLDEIEAGRVSIQELDATRVNRLSRHRDAAIRTKAKKLLAAAVPADRQKVLKEYQKSLTLADDPKRGELVFRKHCMTCHRVGNVGVDVAPDIADSRTKKPSQLLTSIIDPNRAVDGNYFSYSIVTTQGKVLTGIMGAETAVSITLRQEENKTVSVLRKDIEEVRSNGVSLMPVGLEKNITQQQMADLISFIKNWRYLDGRVPIKLGN